MRERERKRERERERERCGERDLEAECCQVSRCLIPQVPDVLKRYQAEVVHWSEGGVRPETIPVRVIHTRHRLCVCV